MTRVSRKPASTGPTTVVGVVRKTKHGLVVEPFEPDATPIEVSVGSRGKAREGDAVEASVTTTGRGRRAVVAARIDEVLGPLGRPGVDVEIVARRHGIRRAFPEAARVAAARIARAIPPRELARRERFDDPPPVTIDGETARDFDDAVAVADGPEGGFRLYVHVADVSWYVTPGGPIDREARERGTSVYFPDRVFPMVPQRLADDLCSLRPGEDRLVQSAIIDFDRRGEVLAARFADGVIRSAARLTYGQVASCLEGGGAHPPITAEIGALLHRAEALRARLEERRRARGSIDFDLPAPTILLDVEGAMTGITIEPRNRAHRMIEEFMLAANEAVARWLSAKGAPCLFRVHEEPDPAKIDALAAFARSLGFELAVPRDGVRPADVTRLLESAEGRPAYPIVAQMALRSMKQARYAPEDAGHFGLAAPHYLHFTSPIRRYPDLVAHRSLRAARRNGRARHGDLAELAESCSRLEREAESAEREVLDWKKVKFLEGREGDAFAGLVTGVARFGLFVQLDGGIAEGLLRVERLGGGWYEHHPERQELRDPRSGRSFRLGDAVRVVVLRVDVPRRRVDLGLEERGEARSAREPDPPSEPTRGPRRRRGRRRVG